MTASSTRSAWAVGNFFSGHEGGRHGAFVERWNGHRWTLLPRRVVPRGSFLADVSADSRKDAWIAGYTQGGNVALVKHWNGRRWARTPVPRTARYNHLFAIDARTPTDVWAVGNSSDGRSGRTLILHWNGERWHITPSPSPPPAPASGRPYATLNAVVATSPDNGWAVGESANVAPAGQSQTLVLHWDGRRWSRIASPNLRNRAGERFDMLFSVAAVAGDDVWAAGSSNTQLPGYGGGGDRSLVEHWNGTRWRIVPTPAVAGRRILYGIAAGEGDVWTVGDQAEPYRTLIERRRPGGWLIAPASAGSLGAITGAPDGRLWAVGQRDGHTLALSCATTP